MSDDPTTKTTDEPEITLAVCGPPRTKCDHDFTGPTRSNDTGLGLIVEATCRKCGAGAFNMWDVWG